MSQTEIYLLVTTIISFSWFIAGSTKETRIVSFFSILFSIVALASSFGIIGFFEIFLILALFYNLISSLVFSRISVVGEITNKEKAKRLERFLFAVFFRASMPLVLVWTIISILIFVF